MIQIFSTFVYQPIYNLFVFFVGFVPGHSILLAIVGLTVLVKLILLPVAHKSIKTQRALRVIDPELKKIKEKHKGNQEAQAVATMKLYQEHGVNPFSGCLLLFIQIPIIFGLYFVFWKGLAGGVIDTSLLYSFVADPGTIDFSTFFIDLREKSLVLALLAGITQYFQMKLSIPPLPPEENTGSFSDEFKKSLNTQMRYVLPVIIIFVSAGFPAAVPLYWTTSNVFSVIHELWVRKEAKLILRETNSPQA
jgi:YidC/Oxa1 family membrane protein insertase